MGIPSYLQDWSSWPSPMVLADAFCWNPLLLGKALFPLESQRGVVYVYSINSVD